MASTTTVLTRAPRCSSPQPPMPHTGPLRCGNTLGVAFTLVRARRCWPRQARSTRREARLMMCSSS
eukprot:954098-Alexandrium_andersonii.AAC.1